MDGLTPMHIWTSQLELVGYKKNESIKFGYWENLKGK